MSADEEDTLSDASKNDLVKFLSKVDEIGDLVKGLSTSQDKVAADEAIKKADTYLQGATKKDEPSGGFDRTIVNAPSSNHSGKGKEGDPILQQQEFCRTLEEDAWERGERRKQREAAGREWKRKGTQAFRRGDVEVATEHYTEAIKETPWIISLYTNRALCYNKLGRYEEAISDCDKAIRFEPSTVRAYVHKGKALCGLDQHSKGVLCYLEALKLNPEAGIRTEIQSALDSAKLGMQAP